jgi:hypothetical protein
MGVDIDKPGGDNQAGRFDPFRARSGVSFVISAMIRPLRRYRPGKAFSWSVDDGAVFNHACQTTVLLLSYAFCFQALPNKKGVHEENSAHFLRSGKKIRIPRR